MTPNSIKLRFIYYRFLAVLAGLLVGYTGLYWWLVIDRQLVPTGAIIVTWIVPVLLAASLACVFLYKRIRLLALKRYRGNPMIGYMLAIIGMLAASVITTQYLLIDVAGKLVVLDTPEGVANYPNARYFTIKQYRPDVIGSHAKVFSHLTGKRKVNMAHDLIIALPLYPMDKVPPATKIRPMTIVRGADGKATLEKAADYPATKVAPAWICFQYHALIRYSRPESEKQQIFQQFTADARADFEESASLPFTYLLRPLNKGIIDRFTATVQEATGSYELEHLVLQPIFTPFEERYQESLLWSVGCMVGSCLVMLGMVMTPALDYPNWEKWKTKKAGPR